MLGVLLFFQTIFDKLAVFWQYIDSIFDLMPFEIYQGLDFNFTKFFTRDHFVSLRQQYTIFYSADLI